MMINHVTSTTNYQHLYPHKDRSDNKLAEHKDKLEQRGSLSSETSQKVLNDKLENAIDRVLQKNQAAASRATDSHDYTPKSVSKHILNYIQDAIDRVEARGGNGQVVLAQARQGVKRGFQEAENLLTSLNALSGKIAESVHNTFELIQGGLDRLEKSMTHAPVTEQVSFEGAKHSIQQSLSLDIKTQDGDIVTLNLAKSESSSAYQAQIHNGNSTTTVKEFQFSSNSQFEFTVQGNLDEGEMEAIEKLLSDVKGVSDQFFEGDASAALEAGLGLGFNTSEIAGFSLNLKHNQTQSAAQAYREISGFGDHSQPPTQLDNLLNPIHDFAKTLEGTLLNAADSALFDEDAVENAFSFFSKSNEAHEAMIQQLEKLSGLSFDDMAHDLISQIKP